MNTATTLTSLLSARLITAAEHATLSRMTQDDYISSLHMEAGDYGLFFPANPTERCFARFWTEEQYSWRDMLADIDDFGAAHAITSRAQARYWDASVELGQEDHARDVLREELAKNDDELRVVQQAACDAVEFDRLTGVALDAAIAIDDGDEEALAMLVESVREISE